MTRETYIKLRKEGQVVLIAYNHYYEKCLEKSQAPIDFSGFNVWFPRYTGAQHIVDSLINHYDKEFEVTIVQTVNVKLKVTKEVNIF